HRAEALPLLQQRLQRVDQNDADDFRHSCLAQALRDFLPAQVGKTVTAPHPGDAVGQAHPHHPLHGGLLSPVQVLPAAAHVAFSRSSMRWLATFTFSVSRFSAPSSFASITSIRCSSL